MIYQMAKAFINGKTGNIMKDSSKKEKNMGLENTFGKILVIMKEIGFPI